MKLYIGIDIGGTDVKYGVVQEDGQIIYKAKDSTPEDSEELVKQLADTVRKLKEKYTIEGVGVSLPGIVKKDGYMVEAGAIYGFAERNMREVFCQEFGCEVATENDVNCAALAERWVGNGSDTSDFVVITFGTGIGGAVIINDKLVRGANFKAGEFGLLIKSTKIKYENRMEMFGHISSVRDGLVKRYAMRKEVSADGLNGKLIYEFAKNGDKIAIDSLNELYNEIAMWLLNIEVILDPQKILIGGAISTNNEFLESIRNRVDYLRVNHGGIGEWGSPEILPCKHRNDAGIIGAVYNYISQ